MADALALGGDEGRDKLRYFEDFFDLCVRNI